MSGRKTFSITLPNEQKLDISVESQDNQRSKVLIDDSDDKFDLVINKFKINGSIIRGTSKCIKAAGTESARFALRKSGAIKYDCGACGVSYFDIFNLHNEANKNDELAVAVCKKEDIIQGLMKQMADKDKRIMELGDENNVSIMEETISEKDIIIHELINDLANKNETISQMIQELKNMKKALLNQKEARLYEPTNPNIQCKWTPTYELRALIK